ncbi:HK97-gp10 family putative phage morphogenesis protein [Streptomyces sp. NPDC048389]|uniref:HK97-gp10 family putative phage morphogenesis protein n=1 Tax=Streptomyces sp. NPDC048389 TaxID=3154622 RepID=UPI0034547A2D
MARQGYRVQILGIARLRGQLEDLSDEIQAALKKAVKESAQAVLADAKRDVARDSNNLFEKLDITYDQDGFTANVGWHEPEEYYGRFLEFGTRRFEAKPALRPALEAERGRYRARLTDEVRKVLR